MTAVEQLMAKVKQLDERDVQSLLLPLVDTLVEHDHREADGVYARWEADRAAMEQQVGVTVQWLADELWDLRIRGVVTDTAVAPLDDQNATAKAWRVVPQGGEDPGPMTFAEAVDAVRAIRAERGSLDPLLATALQVAVDEAWIDAYEHHNVNGTAIYGLRAVRPDGVHEWAGGTDATRAALWAMTLMAMRDMPSD